MIYTIYDNKSNFPTKEEINSVWSVLLFGDNVHILSSFTYITELYYSFPHLSLQQQFEIYKDFKKWVTTPWAQFEGAIQLLKTLRQKKHKNAGEMKAFHSMEKWKRDMEKWFLREIDIQLAGVHYSEICKLIGSQTEEMDTGISLSMPQWNVLNVDPEKSYEHYVKVAVDALCNISEMFVLDETIDAFIKRLPLDEHRGQVPTEGGKAAVLSQYILTVPLCFNLKANEINLARQELVKEFHPFHEHIEVLTTNLSKQESNEKSVEIIQDAMKDIVALCSQLQQKVDNNIYVIKVLNEKEAERVMLHLAFTTNKNILQLLKDTGMLNEEDYLQAYDSISKASALDCMRPFLYLVTA